MKTRNSLTLFLCPAIAVLTASHAAAQLTNYWPVTESSGSTTANAAGGTAGTLFSGAGFVTDGTRGQVLSFAGSGQYVDAGSIPALSTSSNYTWSFWANSAQGANNNVIIGNRYNFAGGDYVPREFTKFTTSQFEWHVNNGGQNVNYPDVSTGSWFHQAVVKNGNMLISYRNGLVNGTNIISNGLLNSQPLYFGGNQGIESWAGMLDDVGTWSSPLPSSSVVGLANGTYTPATAPLTSGSPLPILTTDGFDSLAGWTSTTRGLENNAPAGYNAPAVSGGALSLSGTTTSQYWYGTSVESLTNYDATKPTEVNIDRVALSGSGTAFRSSFWILGDDSHYLHFSQNVNEGGWSWNSRDDGGQGTLNSTGAGNNLSLLDGLDGDLGTHTMSITLEPTGSPGDVNMYLYLDGTLAGAQGFSNFPDTFKVVLTGQGRAAGDSVNAQWDNLTIKQVPEPAATATLAMAGLALLRRRRR